MATKLDSQARSAALAQLEHWTDHATRDAISRRLQFADFVSAFAFMTEIALVAEKMGHHPEWSNVYNRIEITLSTHDAGGLSALDVEMARAIDQAHARFVG